MSFSTAMALAMALKFGRPTFFHGKKKIKIVEKKNQGTCLPIFWKISKIHLIQEKKKTPPPLLNL